MPRIDPLKLLTCLKVLLAPNGGIRSANEVKRLAELMAKYSKKLVSKCIYIQILKCTDTELLGKFMGVGGWLLTYSWLSEGIRAMNWPLVQEILELLLLCPVDVQRLRSNTAPKLVKGLSKDVENEGVRILAAKLVEQWLKVVKGETMAAAGTTPQDNQTAASSNENFVAQTANPAVVQNQVDGTQANQSVPLASGSTADDDVSGQNKNSSDAALVYKIVVKDGKQMLAKVVNGVSEESSEADDKNDKSEMCDSVSGNEVKNEENFGDKQSNKENDNVKCKETDRKDSKDKDSEKEKSRSSSSSKDKDKHRDHKSSSSSRHKSSSSSSKSSSSKSSSSSSSKSKSHSSSSSSSKHSSDRDKHRSSSSSKSSSSHSSSRDSKDRSKREKDRSKESEKEPEKSQSDKDKETLLKIGPSSVEKLGKIPKKPREVEDESSSSEPLVTSITIPSKKASMSIEIRKDSNRPKTVKTFNSQFRSHGLSEEAPPPPSRKGLKKPPVQSIPGTAIPSSTLLTKRLSPPPQSASSSPLSAGKEILPPAEKKLKIDLTTAPGVEIPGAVKFIAPKPKPSLLVESDMFMDALSAAAPLKKDIRKRKRRTSNSKDPGKDGSSPPESPVGNKVAPLKFYQDTLEEDERSESLDDSRDEGTEEKKNDDEDDIPLKRVKEQIEERVREEKQEEERLIRENEDPAENVKKPPGPGCGPNGPPGVLMLHRRKGPKKKLMWRTQDQLEEIRYFEMDENERVNVTKTFTDMKQMERFNERDAFVLARKLNCEDVMAEQTPWTALVVVDDVPVHPDGSQSKEKKIQMERELTTLKALYFNRHMIPDSPSEPDMEQYQLTEPATIPIDDITGNPDAVNDFTNMPWPDPKGSPPHGDEFMGGPDMPFPNGQFNPFMPFGGVNGGWMGPNNGPPNGVPAPGMMGPMTGPFNNMMGGPPHGMMMNGPPQSMMMGGPPDDMGMNCNMNMMPPFGPPGPNFGGPPNNGMGFNNFGPPMNNMSPPSMNMNNGPPRGGGGGGRGGSWRSGSAGPPGGGSGGGGGGNWRGQGGGGAGPPNSGGGRNWMPGSSHRICKQFQRGFCRNGSKCNFLHPPPNNIQRF